MNHNATNQELCALSDKELLTRLSLETRAASRIYEVEGQTRCDSVVLDSGCELLLKREDLSKVHSYKWRGSYNKIASLVEKGFGGELVCASAGNHAQGVAFDGSKAEIQSHNLHAAFHASGKTTGCASTWRTVCGNPIVW